MRNKSVVGGKHKTGMCHMKIANKIKCQANKDAIDNYMEKPLWSISLLEIVRNQSSGMTHLQRDF